jgi:ubiquinone biosynthesis protein
MLKARHAGRYKDIVLLFARYGRDFSVRGPADALSETVRVGDPGIRERAARFASELKRLGPTFVKFGQVLSTRPDVVPPEYLDALASFQDDLPPFPFAQVRETVEAELGGRLHSLFRSFEREPVAAASLGQVHRARLPRGPHVAVKVQRPGIREKAESDMAVFEEIAGTLEAHTDVARKMNLVQTVRQLRRTLAEELDYLQECRNMKLLRAHLAEFKGLRVPRAFDDLTTAKVITTEFVRGVKVSKASAAELSAGRAAHLAPELVRAYLKQVCVDGFWHCDPHPGNVFLTGDKLTLIDFGMTARISGEFQDYVSKFLLCVTDNRGGAAADICLKLGTPQEGFDRERFARGVSETVSSYFGADPSRTSAGRLVFDIIATANANDLQIPSELALLGKTLLQLDGISKTLDPKMNPRAVIRGYAEGLIAKKIRQKFRPRNFYTALLELNQLALDLPRHVREFLEKADEGRLSLNMRLSQGEDLLTGLQKIANRITVGLVIASVVVGSSWILSAAGPPGGGAFHTLALGGYAAAVTMGIYLVLSTVHRDREDRHRAMSKLKE